MPAASLAQNYPPSTRPDHASYLSRGLYYNPPKCNTVEESTSAQVQPGLLHHMYMAESRTAANIAITPNHSLGFIKNTCYT
ncbi:hypothetical protein M3J09_007419 [Ascochyta lentis]